MNRTISKSIILSNNQLFYQIMAKANSTVIVQKLNNNCLHKDHGHWVKWDPDDLQIDNYFSHRSYCLHSYSYYNLCDSCSKILKEYEELYNIIIGSAFETFNKILEMDNKITKSDTNKENVPD